jgi:hypothetical protein
MEKGFYVVRKEERGTADGKAIQFRYIVSRLRYKTALDTRNEVFPNSKRICSNDDGKFNVSE